MRGSTGLGSLTKRDRSGRWAIISHGFSSRFCPEGRYNRKAAIPRFGPSGEAQVFHCMPASVNAAARPGIREFIADRENLPVSARTRFYGVLDQFGAFRPRVRRRDWRLLLLVSVALFLACWTFDRPAGWREAWPWPCFLVLCTVPVWTIRRHERLSHQVDRETEWRAYCLFLRPLIVARFPGLLDRNLDSPMPAPNQIVPRPRSLLREIFTYRGLDFWWAALVGLWCGMALLLVMRLVWGEVSDLLPLVMAVLGFVGGPVLWSFGQALVYHVAQKGVAEE